MIASGGTGGGMKSASINCSGPWHAPRSSCSPRVTYSASRSVRIHTVAAGFSTTAARTGAGAGAAWKAAAVRSRCAGNTPSAKQRQTLENVETCLPGSGTKRANGVAMHAAEHVVRFYETDASLLDAIATFCADAILADEAALVVATAEHRAGIAERLRARRLLGAEDNHDSYCSLDAAETLSQFMV